MYGRAMEPVHPLLAGPQLLLTWPYLVIRGLDDLHKAVVIAEDTNKRMRAIEEHAVSLQGQLDAVVDIGNEVVGVGKKFEAGAKSIIAEGKRIEAAAKQVSERASDVIAALPVLEQAMVFAQPLEGAVQRLGRFLEGLPGSGGGSAGPQLKP
jgi:hypothetical protein